MPELTRPLAPGLTMVATTRLSQLHNHNTIIIHDHMIRYKNTRYPHFLIGREGSRDLETGLSLVTATLSITIMIHHSICVRESAREDLVFLAENRLFSAQRPYFWILRRLRVGRVAEWVN